jgi:hypothetical protein
MRGPHWSLPFHISTNTSNISIEAVLGKQEDHKPYAIYYINKNPTLAEFNYTVT